MNAHVTDSALYRDFYGTGEMRVLFSDTALLEKWIGVEIALARAEAEAGVIPMEAYREIEARGTAASFDMDDLRGEMLRTSHPLVPFIKAYERLCGGGLGEYVHFGATTQDILDTAFVLQLKDGYDVIRRQLASLVGTLAEKTEAYRLAPMAGRTHGQHALPITFGFKLAVWLAELDRHEQRLVGLVGRVFVGQLYGAAGTLAALGPQGLEVQRRMMELLGLGVPDTCLHTSRDHLAELAVAYGMLAATLGKIANEIINLQRTELAEVEEGFRFGKIGSSTMPHKRNPMVCEYIAGLSRLVRSQMPLAFESMIQEHERDMGLWLAEWAYLSEITMYLGAMLEQTGSVLENMIVDERKMRDNLELTRGLILSERLMFALSPQIGKQTAHDVVYRASMRAVERRTSLLHEIGQEEEVARLLPPERLEQLMDAESYVGLSAEFVDRVLAKLGRGDVGKGERA